MSVSRQERSETMNGHFDRSSSQSGREVILAWLGLVAGVALLYGASKTETPGHGVEEAHHSVQNPAPAVETTWVRRLHTNPPEATPAVVGYEFLNCSEKSLAHVAVVVRETDRRNRLVRDHRESAENLSAGQGWIFKVRPLNPENSLSVATVLTN